MYEIERKGKAKLIHCIHNLMGVRRRITKITGNYERMISKYSQEDSMYWCNHGNWQGKLEYARKEQYGKGICVKFEGMNVRVPEKYDEYLTQKYGDWKADLPEEEQKGHHYYVVCDVNRSYKEYILENK